MLTEVTVRVPFGQEDVIIAAANQIGGKTLYIHEEALVAGGINPNRLARHLRMNGVKTDEVYCASDTFDRANYASLFTFLRELPFEQQQRLLESFLSGKMRVPQVGQRLGGFLAKVNNIDWLEPQEELDRNRLQQVSDASYEQLGMAPLPIATERNWEILGSMIMRNFSEDQSITFELQRKAWESRLNSVARAALGEHRDYREAVEAQRMVNAILGDLSIGSWQGRVRELRYWAGEGYSMSDFGKLGVLTAIQSDTRLAAASIVLGKYLPQLGYTHGTIADGLFDGIYDKGYVFIGPIEGQSVIFTPQAKSKSS